MGGVRVRYLQGMGRPKGPGIQPGDVRDVDPDEAERLIAKDIAVDAKGETLKSKADEAEATKPRPGRKATSHKAAGAEKRGS